MLPSRYFGQLAMKQSLPSHRPAWADAAHQKPVDTLSLLMATTVYEHTPCQDQHVIELHGCQWLLNLLCELTVPCYSYILELKFPFTFGLCLTCKIWFNAKSPVICRTCWSWYTNTWPILKEKNERLEGKPCKTGADVMPFSQKVATQIFTCV